MWSGLAMAFAGYGGAGRNQRGRKEARHSKEFAAYVERERREREARFCFRRAFPLAVVEEGWKRKSQTRQTPARNHGFVCKGRGAYGWTSKWVGSSTEH